LEKGGGSNGCDGSRKAHIELWVPCTCMKGMKTDWLGHITWRKVKVKIKVSNLEILDKGVEACNIWSILIIKLILLNMSQSTLFIGDGALKRKEQG